MTSNYVIAISVLFASIIASRVQGERALRMLSVEEKGRLLEAFSAVRLYSLIPLAVILFVMFALPNLVPGGPRWLPLLGLPAYAIYVVVLYFIVTRKLAAAGLPDEFRRNYLFSRNIGHAGLILFFVIIVYDFFS